ncbi:hypothetical protein [Plantactinospora soyae]|uniref:Secreted protein n=1 Tax=Plantactinospora soyae TaxID=1544732 RepID=A0A927ME85_9ACTN|nr:hypothetical protein [Plantactinospora soyae]MBE1492050.1 hypothetical protein [Plantactinospora soyae]
MRKTRRALALTALVTTVSLIGLATPAPAAPGRLGNDNASGAVSTVSGLIKVCDLKADGRRAVIEVSNVTRNYELGRAEDVDGANGGSDAACTLTPLAAPVRAGDLIFFQIWTQDGGGDKPQWNYLDGTLYG